MRQSGAGHALSGPRSFRPHRQRIDAIAAELKAKGVEFTKEPTTVRPGVRVCFIRGPQGISIELLERWAV